MDRALEPCENQAMVCVQGKGGGTVQRAFPRFPFTDLLTDSQRLVLEHLSARDLCRMAAASREMYLMIHVGLSARDLWKKKCVQALGMGMVVLHLRASPETAPHFPRFWLGLWRNAHELTVVRWWREGAQSLKRSVDEEDQKTLAATRKLTDDLAKTARVEDTDGLGERRALAIEDEMAHVEKSNAWRVLLSKVARSGHTSTQIGAAVVIIGGILRDVGPVSDILIVDCQGLAVNSPVIQGQVPFSRLRHTTVAAKVRPGSKTAARVQSEIGTQHRMEEGYLAMSFGGYNGTGEEFGGFELEGLWISHDLQTVICMSLLTSGDAPAPRFHHSADVFDDGQKMVLYGGEAANGLVDVDTATEHPFIYILDFNELKWEKQTTTSEGDGANPGLRSLHLTTVRQSPQTGHTELVVVGGYLNKGLVSMVPHTLDLATFTWEVFTGIDPGSPDVKVPCPRQRAASVRITDMWLLVCGGSPEGGSFLDDAQRLHLPTLTWREPLHVEGQPSHSVRRIAGHSMAGLLAFGGCVPTLMGIMPVAKMDFLLIGPPVDGEGREVLSTFEPPPLFTGFPERNMRHLLKTDAAIAEIEDGFIPDHVYEAVMAEEYLEKCAERDLFDESDEGYSLRDSALGDLGDELALGIDDGADPCGSGRLVTDYKSSLLAYTAAELRHTDHARILRAIASVDAPTMPRTITDSIYRSESSQWEADTRRPGIPGVSAYSPPPVYPCIYGDTRIMDEWEARGRALNEQRGRSRPGGWRYSSPPTSDGQYSLAPSEVERYSSECTSPMSDEWYNSAFLEDERYSSECAAQVQYSPRYLTDRRYPSSYTAEERYGGRQMAELRYGNQGTAQEQYSHRQVTDGQDRREGTPGEQYSNRHMGHRRYSSQRMAEEQYSHHNMADRLGSAPEDVTEGKPLHATEGGTFRREAGTLRGPPSGGTPSVPGGANHSSSPSRGQPSSRREVHQQQTVEDRLYSVASGSGYMRNFRDYPYLRPNPYFRQNPYLCPAINPTRIEIAQSHGAAQSHGGAQPALEYSPSGLRAGPRTADPSGGTGVRGVRTNPLSMHPLTHPTPDPCRAVPSGGTTIPGGARSNARTKRSGAGGGEDAANGQPRTAREESKGKHRIPKERPNPAGKLPAGRQSHAPRMPESRHPHHVGEPQPHTSHNHAVRMREARDSAHAGPPEPLRFPPGRAHDDGRLYPGPLPARVQDDPQSNLGSIPEHPQDDRQTYLTRMQDLRLSRSLRSLAGQRAAREGDQTLSNLSQVFETLPAPPVPPAGERRSGSSPRRRNDGPRGDVFPAVPPRPAARPCRRPVPLADAATVPAEDEVTSLFSLMESMWQYPARVAAAYRRPG